MIEMLRVLGVILCELCGKKGEQNRLFPHSAENPDFAPETAFLHFN